MRFHFFTYVTIQLLKLGAFELSKVGSRTTLNLLEIDNHDRMSVIIRDNAADSCILGMQCQDMFQFLCKLNTEAHVVSKRVILSEITKLFNPLGLLGPVIVIAKLILQDL